MHNTINSDDLVAGFMDVLHAHTKKSVAEEKKLSPEEIAELYHSAYHFYQNGKYKEAVTFFQALTSLESANVHYWMGYASSLKMSKEFQKALDAYIIAGMLNVQDPHIHAHAADCCFALGQIDRGLTAVGLAKSLAKKYGHDEDFISQLAEIKKAWSNHKNNSN